MAKKKEATKEDFLKCGEAIQRAKKSTFTIDDFLEEYFDDLCELRFKFNMSIMQIATLLAENGAPGTAGSIKPLVSKKLKECTEEQKQGAKKETEDIKEEEIKTNEPENKEKESQDKKEDKDNNPVESKSVVEELKNKEYKKTTPGFNVDIDDDI